MAFKTSRVHSLGGFQENEQHGNVLHNIPDCTKYHNPCYLSPYFKFQQQGVEVAYCSANITGSTRLNLRTLNNKTANQQQKQGTDKRRNERYSQSEKQDCFPTAQTVDFSEVDKVARRALEQLSSWAILEHAPTVLYCIRTCSEEKQRKVAQSMSTLQTGIRDFKKELHSNLQTTLLKQERSHPSKQQTARTVQKR